MNHLIRHLRTSDPIIDSPLTLAAVLIVLVIIVVLIKQRRPPNLRFSSLSNTYRQNVGYVCLWNSGSSAIHGSDLSPMNPIRIVVPESIVRYSLLYSKNENSKFRIESPSDHSILVAFDQLEKGDGCIIEVEQSGELLCEPKLIGCLIDGNRPREILMRRSKLLGAVFTAIGAIVVFIGCYAINLVIYFILVSLGGAKYTSDQTAAELSEYPGAIVVILVSYLIMENWRLVPKKLRREFESLESRS